jgi:SNF2 family DNA or RNA helicase
MGWLMAKYKLMKHQRQGVRFLDRVDGIGALLFDPGVGKTGTTMAYLDLLASRQQEVRVLVVAPLTAVDTWVLQVPLFMNSPTKARMLSGSTLKILSKMSKATVWSHLPVEKIQCDHAGRQAEAAAGQKITILAMSAGAVSSFCTTRPNTVALLRAVRKYKPDVIVMDESHLIKSATANISKAMYQIGQLAPHRIILTGTVTPLSPLDVYGQWRFLAPWTFSNQADEPYVKKPLTMTKTQMAAIKPWPWSRFKMRYTIPGGYKGKGIGGYYDLHDLHDRVSERSFVVLKEDALDLPPTTDVNVHITLSPREQKAYDEMAKDLAMELADGSLLEAPNVLAKIMKLRQIAAGFVKDTATDEVHVVGTTLQKAVSEIVNVQLAGENRIVVFAYFKRECAMLAEALKKKGRTVELITGETKSGERLAIRQRFGDVSGNPEPVVLVAQARTMSLSVNELVTAQHAVYASMSERRADWVQSRGRLDRQGQTKPVTFWNVYAPGTVQEVMLDTHIMRGDLERSLLDHIRNYFK